MASDQRNKALISYTITSILHSISIDGLIFIAFCQTRLCLANIILLQVLHLVMKNSEETYIVFSDKIKILIY